MSQNAERGHWRGIRVQRGAEVLAGRDRLVALYRWLRREASPDLEFFSAERVADDPMSFDWANFPLGEAVDAARDADREERSGKGRR